MSYYSCTRFITLIFTALYKLKNYEKLKKSALVKWFLSHGRNLCRGSATATSEVKLEQVYIVCDRKALGFCFSTLLGCLSASSLIVRGVVAC